jgi:hypothetical protein
LAASISLLKTRRDKAAPPAGSQKQKSKKTKRLSGKNYTADVPIFHTFENDEAFLSHD